MTADNAHEQTNDKENLPKQENFKTSCRRAEIGAVCPVCSQGILEYNGLLNLVCPHCGREWTSSFT